MDVQSFKGKDMELHFETANAIDRENAQERRQGLRWTHFHQTRKYIRKNRWAERCSRHVNIFTRPKGRPAHWMEQIDEHFVESRVKSLRAKSSLQQNQDRNYQGEKNQCPGP